MSHQRSPPPTSPALATGPTLYEVCAPEICESDTASERSCSRNVSVRNKRRHGDDDIKELKGLISSLTSKEERADDKKTIQKLEEKIEFLERKNRSTSLEIRNIPICLQDDKKFESKEDASLIVKTLAKAVEVDIQDCDIKDIYRIQTNREGSKPIIVELNSVLKKDKIVLGVKNYNRKKPNEDKLNTRHLNIPGPVKPVYISEALTPNAQKLFYAARQFARENGYMYCWTSHGSVFLRKAEGEPQTRIESAINLKLLAKK
ncbi:hypothetical protein HW555_003124 [Spodoptera exigua]|uniref:FP protein C-terminal domain-containing protein n=1 Tax=Spodoptera exigua TaxID=7107 RepID=A0A835GNJ8_SPOEX|nr:hypothetical protein HW555_003124 [Spodoptera exigua]